ncbi:MAG: hypothetical protein JAY75_20615, partial [Candidatus Thiodiazotropha taylori]|nr:hypothetical protein [Candidatus Thiodiazotropha taylori]MCW4310623.1 hypothetical protein [Candidatus Thiodiazotropha endolucinida]
IILFESWSWIWNMGDLSACVHLVVNVMIRELMGLFHPSTYGPEHAYQSAVSKGANVETPRQVNQNSRKENSQAEVGVTYPTAKVHVGVQTTSDLPWRKPKVRDEAYHTAVECELQLYKRAIGEDTGEGFDLTVIPAGMEPDDMVRSWEV